MYAHQVPVLAGGAGVSRGFVSAPGPPAAASRHSDADSARALVALAVAYFASFASGGILLPLTAMAMHNVGLSPSAIGLMWGARALSSTVAPFGWGVLADRRGNARPFVVASLLLGALLLLVLSQVTRPLWAILVFGLYGLLANPASSLMDGMTLTALGPQKHRFGRVRAFGTVGFGLSALSATMLIEQGTLAALPSRLFPIAALCLVTGAIVIWRFCPPLSRPSLGRLRDVHLAFRQRTVVGLVVTAGLLWCSHAAYSSFLAPLTQAQGLPASTIGWSIAAAVLVEALAMSLTSRILFYVSARRVVVGVAVITVVRWTLTPLFDSVTAFVLLSALHGLTFGLLFTTIVSIIATQVPEELRQASQGMLSSFSFGIGGFVGAVLCGWVLEHTNASTTWWTMAVIAVPGVISAFRATRSPWQSHPPLRPPPS